MPPTGSQKDPENLTRKQRREQAREERKAAEAAAAAAAGRRKRLMQLGSVAAAVVVIIVVIVLVTSGGKGPGTATTTGASAPLKKGEKSAAVSAVTSLLSGIHQSGNVLGKPNAPVTMQYYGDLECPICKEFTLDALPGIIAKEVRTGKLRIEYRSFSTATGNAEAAGSEPHGTFNNQQVAAYAAGKQNLGWDYIELFYHEQGAEGSGYVTESFIQGIAQQVPGLNLKTWSADRAEKSLETQVIDEQKAAIKNGFQGTPSFMIGKTGGPSTAFNPSSIRESSAFEPAIEKYASS